jgi:hypothetical protein
MFDSIGIGEMLLIVFSVFGAIFVLKSFALPKKFYDRDAQRAILKRRVVEAERERLAKEALDTHPD